MTKEIDPQVELNDAVTALAAASIRFGETSDKKRRNEHFDEMLEQQCRILELGVKYFVTDKRK